MPNLNKDFLAVIIQTISQYLEAHKRLVVPQLGAFIVKEPGQVLFSELLKRDDGLLRGLLRDEGMNELEAAGEIDRFVFEVRHAVEHGSEYRMGGFGVLKPGPNDTIAFVYDPGPAAPEPEPEPGKSRSEKVAESVKNAFSDLNVSPSAKLSPDPYVKGLRYGRPHKNTNAYTYVGMATRRWRVDRFLLVAVVAAVIAVAAIAFGYYRMSRDEQAGAEQTEQTAVEPVENPQSEQPVTK